jgi:tetratricopeptide (TPR) repeat protein
VLQSSLHNYSQAGEYFNQALKLARTIGDQAGIADSLNRLGSFNCSSGQLEDARTQHSQALDIAHKLDDRSLQATSLDGLARVDLMRGHLQASSEEFSQAVQLRRRLADRVGLIESLSMLAAASVWKGDYQQAADACREGLEFISRLGDLRIVSPLHTWFAVSQLKRGELETVEAQLQTGLDVARRLDYLDGQIQSRIWLGYFYLAIARLDAAVETIEQAATLVPAAASTLAEAQVRTCQGAIHLERGQAEQALDILTTACQATRETNSTPDRLMALYEQGRAGLVLARWDIADRAMQQISDVPEFGEFREYQMRGCWLRGMLALEQNDPDAALRWLAEARAQAEAIHAWPVLWRIDMAFGDVYHQSGRGSQAGPAYQRAWEILESMVNTLPNHVDRSTMLDSQAVTRLRARVAVYG